VKIDEGKTEWTWRKTAALAVGTLVALILFASCVGAVARSSQQHPSGSGGVVNLPVPSHTLAPLPPGDVVSSAQAAGASAIASAAEAAQSQQASPDTIPGEGDYEVGPDVKPGKYKTAGPSPDSVYPNCYYERHKASDDSFRGIIKNDNVKGPTTVTIKQGEMFKTQGCQAWQRVAG
jgi:hypothetical protein